MNNENPVIDEITENVDEQTTEELVDGAKTESEGQEPEQKVEEPLTETFTKEQVDEIVKRRLGRQETKIRKEYEKKYGKLENVLRAGTGEEDIESITNTFTDFYTKKGIQIPKAPQYSQREAEILAEAEANDIISAGYDDIKEEVDRLANIGADNMTPQEKIIFSKLATERTRIEDEKSLASIGVTKVDDDFKEFAKNLNPSLSMKEKYEMYEKYKPKAKVETIGSMKTTTPNKVKDYYTPEEVDNLTREDLKNPKVMEAVDRSMAIWYGNK